MNLIKEAHGQLVGSSFIGRGATGIWVVNVVIVIRMDMGQKLDAR